MLTYIQLLQHVEVPIPTPKKDELLIKLGAVSLNPVDWKIQKGLLRPLFPRRFPHIPGNSTLLLVFTFLEALEMYASLTFVDPYYVKCFLYDVYVCNITHSHMIIE